MSDSTAHREWTVAARFVGAPSPGMATVAIDMINGRAGRMPPINVEVDWKPGMEPVDLEVFALALVADAGAGLSDACVALATSKSLKAGR